MNKIRWFMKFGIKLYINIFLVLGLLFANVREELIDICS